MAADEITKEDLGRFGRYIASKRGIVSGVCEICGTPFEGTRKRRYCSNKCRVQAHRRRADSQGHPK